MIFYTDADPAVAVTRLDDQLVRAPPDIDPRRAPRQLEPWLRGYYLFLAAEHLHRFDCPAPIPRAYTTRYNRLRALSSRPPEVPVGDVFLSAYKSPWRAWRHLLRMRWSVMRAPTFTRRSPPPWDLFGDTYTIKGGGDGRVYKVYSIKPDGELVIVSGSGYVVVTDRARVVQLSSSPRR